MRETPLLKPGTPAPDFTLKATPDQVLSLSSFRGQPVVLAFYPADFSPVCSDQMSLYGTLLDEFRRYGAQLLGVSVDGAWCHQAFAHQHQLGFPLLADSEPKGEVSRRYGAYDAKEGTCERALFVIDADGKVAWSHLAPTGINPGADGILEALARLYPDRAAEEVRP